MATFEVLHEIRRACRPHGVATSDELRLTSRQLQRACRNGVLQRPHAGVFVDPSTPRSPLQDLAVAIAAASPMGCAWGRSAAALWRLLDEHPLVPEIVVPVRRFARIPGAVVHRSSDLCPSHIMLREQLPVTKPLITALDLGVVLSPMDLAEVLVRARELKLFEPEAVEATLRRIAKPGRTGIRTARAALELVMIGDRPADSVLELRFHHGPGRLIPPYEYQWKVVARGKPARIDFAYPAVKVGIEVDGYEKRRSAQSLDRDGRRSNRLLLEGWTLLHFSWNRVLFDQSGVASEVLLALCNAGYQFGR